MRKGFLLLLFLALGAPWGRGVDYLLPVSNASAAWENQAAYAWLTNTSPETIAASELPFSHFLIVTNGATLYAGSNFEMGLRAVDAYGYHVTLTNGTNLLLSALRSNLAPAPGVLGVGSLVFLSPPGAIPDYSGIVLTQSYSRSGKIYVSPSETNPAFLSPPGLLTFQPPAFRGILAFDRPRYLGWGTPARIILTDSDRNFDPESRESLAIQVASATDPDGFWILVHETGTNTGVFTNAVRWEGLATLPPNRLRVADGDLVRLDYRDPDPPALLSTNALFQTLSKVLIPGPLFLPPQRDSNLVVLGVSSDGFTNDVSLEYSFARSTERGVSTALGFGPSNLVRAEVPGLGRIWLTNAYSPAFNGDSVVLATVRPDSAAQFDGEGFRVSVPAGALAQEAYVDVRAHSNWRLIQPLRDHAEEIHSAAARLSNQAVILDETLHTVTVLGLDGAERLDPFLVPLQASLGYRDGALSNAEGIVARSGLGVVRLEAGNFWAPVDGVTNAPQSNLFFFPLRKPGLYAVLGTLSRQPTNAQSVSVYPNPFDLRRSAEAYILNLPPNTQQVRIFAVDGTPVRTLSGSPCLGWVELDGKLFQAARWDGNDRNGRPVKMGLYFIEIPNGAHPVVKKLMVLR